MAASRVFPSAPDPAPGHGHGHGHGHGQKNPAAGATTIEWPTWLLIAAVYGAWLLAAAGWRLAGPVAGTPALVLATCWFTSLQHELIHGHPTRWPAINRLFGLAPLAVWYPYDLYRQSHLAHHRDEFLTTPGVDPESNYLSAAEHARLPACLRGLWIARRTVLGRVVLGPPLGVLPLWFDALRKPWRREFAQVGAWALHLGLLGGMLWALDRWAGIGPLRYLLTVAWPALGLAMLRSFHEHRPAEHAPHRVGINEAGWFWRVLYLNNNYHAVHHERPRLPWYAVRRSYLARRDDILARNGGFVVPGYGALLRRHGVTPIDSPVHPMSTHR